MNIPVISFAAFSGAGKTTFIELLIPELKALGLRVAAAKHDGHDFDVDRADSDSGRFTQAGADCTVVFSSSHAVFMENRPLAARDVIGRIENVDIILLEGCKNGPWPKVVLERQGLPERLLPGPDCIAVVTDCPRELPVPCFGLEEHRRFALWLAGFAGLPRP